MNVDLSNVHELTITTRSYFSGPHTHTAVCTCGKWRRTRKGGPSIVNLLRRQFAAHVEAKTR